MVDVSAPVKADGLVLEEAIEGGRQQVLTRVLLHVIEAAGPVDLAADRGACRQRRRQHDAPPAFVVATSTTDAPPSRPMSKGWARRGIEGRPIEHDRGSSVEIERVRHHRVEPPAMDRCSRCASSRGLDRHGRQLDAKIAPRRHAGSRSARQGNR